MIDVDAGEFIAALLAVKGHVGEASDPRMHRIQLRYTSGAPLFVAAGSGRSTVAVRVRVRADHSATSAIDLLPKDVDTIVKWLKPGKDESQTLRISNDKVHTYITESGQLVDGRELRTQHYDGVDVPDLLGVLNVIQSKVQVERAVSVINTHGITQAAATAAALGRPLVLEATTDDGPLVFRIGEVCIGAVRTTGKTEDEDSGAARRREASREWWLLHLPVPSPKSGIAGEETPEEALASWAPPAEEFRGLAADTAALAIEHGWINRSTVIRKLRIDHRYADAILSDLEQQGVLVASEDPNMYDVVPTKSVRDDVVAAIREGHDVAARMIEPDEEQPATLDLGDAAVPELDPMVEQAAQSVVITQFATISMLQRKLRVGLARAGVVMDQLERLGVVAADTGGKSRDVLVKPDELAELLERLNPQATDEDADVSGGEQGTTGS